MAPIVEMRGITKRFPGVVANYKVDFELESGEIHGLLGENGAGKTVLMSILYGLHHPDEGKISVRGKERKIGNPFEAMAVGIGMVHQNFTLEPRLTVLENMILGNEPKKYGILIDKKRARQIIEEASERYGLSIDPGARVFDISVGEQQRVEVLKALYRGTEILILDEPTGVLTDQEIDKLFEVMKNLKSQGKSIILITHKMEEAIAICDRITVLRKGRVVATLDAKDADRDKLAELVIGKQIAYAVKESKEAGEKLLDVSELTALGSFGRRALDSVSFALHRYEILGIAGVGGNGQTELVEVLTGLRKVDRGSVLFGGASITNRSPGELFDLGIVHIPEDRLKRSLLAMSVEDNAILGLHRKSPFAKSKLEQNHPAITEHTKKMIKEFGIKANPLSRVGTLSGGTQQRVILARELGKKPLVIIAAQPTRGLDVAGAEYVHKQLIDARDRGCAVLLVSMDLDEIMALSDRIGVMFKGKIVAIKDPETVTERELGRLMLGGRV